MPDGNQPNDLYFTTKELAQRWKLSERTLEGWRNSGIGPSYKVFGNRVRYHNDAVQAFEKLCGGVFHDGE